MNPKIKELFTLACHAPSGDNSQPWEFKKLEDDNEWEVLNIPDRDNEIFNFQQRGSYIAHGALLENISKIAPAFGMEARVTVFPKNSPEPTTAQISFVDNDQDQDLGEASKQLVLDRATNRGKFSGHEIPEQTLEGLKIAGTSGKTSVFFIKDRKKIKAIARAASTAERVMLQYKPLHQAFFSKIRWSREEESKKGYGLLIDTLELNFPKKLIFKWFSNWKTSKLLRILHLPDLIAKENAKIYSSASAIGIITVPDESKESYISTGISLQKIWLKATEQKISLQPIAGVLYLAKRLESADLPGLPPDLKMLIRNSVKTITDTFSSPTNYTTMLFRIGTAPAPYARSSKSLPKIIF